MRKRCDLSARRQHYLGRSYWVVKEPVGLNYFRFQEEEYAILQWLDGHTSLDEIKERFEAEFPPQKITLEELQQFLGTLHRSGLVVADVPGQGRQLCKRRGERVRKELIGKCSNILCIQFKGFDPERLLNAIYPWFRWVYSPVTMTLCLTLIFCALMLVLVEWDVFQSKLPGFYQFFSPTNALLMAATLGVIKIIHEFGHGLTCKHYGGECHEIGVMILVLTPCLYCNVSDSWMLPSKWQRAAIGVAGMYVEVVIAAICTFVWWFSEPGLLNNLALNAMFLASVSTLIFNGNPLLRYDGYYVLADIAEIPNLRQKATSILSRKMGQLCLGLEPPEDPFLPQRNQIFFALYSVAAAMYRWFVLLSIMWFLYQVFKPYRLEIIGHGIIMMSLYGLIVMPLYKLGKFFYVPGRIDKVKKPRMYATIGVLAALVAAILFVPLPHRVTCPVEVQPRDAAEVHIEVVEGGRLEELFVTEGDQVEQGQLLARLENVDVRLEVERLQGELNQYEIQLANLRRQRYHDRAAQAEIPEVSEALEAVKLQLNDKEEDLARLQLRAPIAGTVLPPPEKPEKDLAEQGQLSDWSGTPLKEKNLGAHLQNTMFCQIGDPRKMEAILVIDQSDRNFVAEGQAVDIKIDQLPHEVFRTRLTSIATDKLEVAPKSLSTKAGGDLPTITDPETGIDRPQSTCYKARAPLDNPEGVLRIGLRGTAKIHTPWQPLGTRIWRLISETFNFRM